MSKGAQLQNGVAIFEVIYIQDFSSLLHKYGKRSFFSSQIYGNPLKPIGGPKKGDDPRFEHLGFINCAEPY